MTREVVVLLSTGDARKRVVCRVTLMDVTRMNVCVTGCDGLGGGGGVAQRDIEAVVLYRKSPRA